MLHPSTQKLIATLVEMTDRREAPWAEDANGVVGFETEGYRVEAEADPPQVRILSGNGSVVERADTAQLLATPWPDGGDFAAAVKRMCTEGARHVRGADKAIDAIMSSLANPPAEFSTEGGAESEAAMAAAVADMATRLRDMPQQSAPPVAAPAAREMFEMAPIERLPAVAVVDLPAPRNIQTHAMFGRTPSFSIGPRPAPITQPVVVGGLSASSVQTPEGKLTPPHVEPSVTPAGKGYRPWS